MVNAECAGHMPCNTDKQVERSGALQILDNVFLFEFITACVHSIVAKTLDAW